MTVGIDASRAFVKTKTGIEEYSYRVIKHLRDCLGAQPVILYLDPRVNEKKYIDFELPKNWKVKFLRAPKFWTQIRLSIEMIFHPVDVLFIPAHTVPLVHPKNTIVTIHGLEYEFCSKAYSLFERLYMRWSIRKSCQWAKKIISVSENTKKDLMRLYKVPEGKVSVIYEGIGDFESKAQSEKLKTTTQRLKLLGCGYFLFTGRLEERKNISGIVDAFEILKRKYKISQKLILVGKFGFGGEEIKRKIDSSEYKSDIILTGYISDEDKFYMMANADAFIFATFYEGFGLPILEAQSVGAPVITSSISSMPEVAGNSAVLIDPKDPNAIAEAVRKLISDESYKNDIIQKGLENVKRFSWEKCAGEVANIIKK
jgi:glycosyltransferase involved in cell wall biosynthesis